MSGSERNMDDRVRTVASSFERLADTALFRRILSSKCILEIRLRGHDPSATSISHRATRLELDYPADEGKALSFPDESQDAVLSSYTLQHIVDYRGAIADWFRLLRVGGFLVINVPHQFLYERKLSLPSRFDASHKRFYTAASLLMEIEEALDPHDYRVRYLEDNDEGFDYNAEPQKPPSGGHNIIVVLERIRRPDYADAVMEDKPIERVEGRARRPVAIRAGASDGPTVIIRSKPHQVRTIAVMKLDHRGDFILAKPAMSELRRYFPSAAITLICGQWNAPDAAAFGIFDDILTFNFFSETRVAAPKWQDAQTDAEFAEMMRGRRFDLAIDLRVDLDTRKFLSMIDAEHRAGFGNQMRFPFLDIDLPIANPTAPDREKFLIGPERFFAKIGTRDERKVLYNRSSYFTSQPEFLIWGPYMTLGPGSYSVEVDVVPLGWRFSVDIDLAANAGTELLKRPQHYTVRRKVLPRLDFDLKEPKVVEVRVLSRKHRFVRPFRFNGCRLRMRNQWKGPHQQELMYMLTSLVGLRMNSPYTVSEVAS
jgi:SAM-dependent methyltransferase